jgi:hypothetical protein
MKWNENKNEMPRNDKAKKQIADIPSSNEVHHAFLEFFAERIQNRALVLKEQFHHALVALGEFVALEAIRVTTLLLTHLAVPAQFLQTFRLCVRGTDGDSQTLCIPFVDWRSLLE